jgi:hypothetical protein
MSRTRYPAVEAVAELIRTRTMRIDITATTGYTVRSPCLLQQLADALGTGGENGGRGIPTSRPLIAPDAWDLWADIHRTTTRWAQILGLDISRYQPEPAPPPRPRSHPAPARHIERGERCPSSDLLADQCAHCRGADLTPDLDPTAWMPPARPRQLTTIRVDQAIDDDPVTTPIGRLLHAVAIHAATARPGPRGADAVERRVREWHTRIDTLLAGVVQERGLRDAECPQCASIRPYPRNLIGPRSGPQPTTTVIEEREEEGRLVPYTVPAIVLVTREYGDVLAWLVCRACGWTKPLVDDTTQLVATSDTPESDQLDAEPKIAA